MEFGREVWQRFVALLNGEWNESAVSDFAAWLVPARMAIPTTQLAPAVQMPVDGIRRVIAEYARGSLDLPQLRGELLTFNALFVRWADSHAVVTSQSDTKIARFKFPVTITPQKWYELVGTPRGTALV